MDDALRERNPLHGFFCNERILRVVACVPAPRHAHLLHDFKAFVDAALITDVHEARAEFLHLAEWLERLERLEAGAGEEAIIGAPSDSIDALSGALDDALDRHLELGALRLHAPPPLDRHELEVQRGPGTDWVARLVPQQDSTTKRAWVVRLDEIWDELRRVTVPGDATRSSLIELPHAFSVPGGRFQEAYYWDSYWVVKGLLICRRFGCAERIVRNFLFLVQHFGFVPNGNRLYYLNRSQPPLLTLMVAEIVHALDADGQVERALGLASESVPLLLREHQFWRTHRAVDTYPPLSQYRVPTECPRPESFRDDWTSGSAFARTSASEVTPSDQQRRLYTDLASAAESGMDFTSRWMALGADPDATLRKITDDQMNRDHKQALTRTTTLVPVCLNSILVKVERGIASLCRWMLHKQEMHVQQQMGAELNLNLAGVAEEMDLLAASRQDAMNALLWDASACTWFDFDLERKTRVTELGPTAASFMPLWAGCLGPDPDDAVAVEKIISALEKSGLVREGGVATTLVCTNEQWDFPNAWPPVQDIIVEGLETVATRHASTRARKLAERIALSVLGTAYAGWQATGFMYEKYDATHTDGKGGGGGEYESAQTGFGWTNGTVLCLIAKYGAQWTPCASTATNVPSP
ncbi:putative trehalase [Porphyridium purpureum]|uniref:Trehalase n=1 Tax=Porphyridium purpureum TaxID=35688 RepID=A0A5J4YSN7_PORPP|nr:putative trehalase [Porphyridium purpureum]|eukprot:POR1764..scf229_5